MARRRCLLVLSVLSGERPVTEAIEEAKLSRGRYYQLEELALQAMLDALSPTPATKPGRPPSQDRKIVELEAKVTRLEQEKRRAERAPAHDAEGAGEGARDAARGGPAQLDEGWARSLRSGSVTRKGEAGPASIPKTGGAVAP
ncbi:MAG: hypothetical protein QM767_23840 [Anaeromyxobacter sp.]